MNSRVGILFSTLLIIAGVLLFSATILAEEVAAVSDSTVRQEMRLSADAAHREAAREAVERLEVDIEVDVKADGKPGLDIGPVGRISTLVAGD